MIQKKLKSNKGVYKLRPQIQYVEMVYLKEELKWTQSQIGKKLNLGTGAVYNSIKAYKNRLKKDKELNLNHIVLIEVIKEKYRQ